MKNLKDETLEILKENGKTFEDVVWIGCNEFTIGKGNFLKCANTLYDDGYGGTEVAEDLVVVGSDWWLERHDYDGSEWWEFKTIPKMPSKIKTVETLVRTDKSEERRYASDNPSYSYTNALVHMAI